MQLFFTMASFSGIKIPNHKKRNDIEIEKHGARTTLYRKHKIGVKILVLSSVFDAMRLYFSLIYPVESSGI